MLGARTQLQIELHRACNGRHMLVHAQSRQKEEPEPKKGKIEEKTSGAFNWFGRKSEQANQKFDEKAPDTKNKAVEIKDSVVSTVKGAADSAKGGIDSVGQGVSSSTKDARNKISDVGCHPQSPCQSPCAALLAGCRAAHTGQSAWS